MTYLSFEFVEAFFFLFAEDIGTVLGFFWWMASTSCTKYVPRSVRDAREAPKLDAVIAEPHHPAPTRAEKEPHTSNMTLYGVCKPSVSLRESPYCSTSYASKDWSSVTKKEFPAVVNGSRLTKELQLERGNFMRSSDITFGDHNALPIAKTTHERSVFIPYTREWYSTHSCFNIGAPHTKTHSNIELTATALTEPQHYEPLSTRQFHGHKVDSQFNSKGHESRLWNKREMMKSHFTVGNSKVDYLPVAKLPLETRAPLVKNRPPSATDPERNPHVVRSAADARPKAMSPRDVAASKMLSHVPVLENTGEKAEFPPTTTAYSFQKFCPRREPKVTSTNVTISSLQLGSDGVKGDYLPATKMQFRGIYFAPSAPTSACM